MARQGELARTIQGIGQVKADQVNLAIPESSLFSEKEESQSLSGSQGKKRSKPDRQRSAGVVHLIAKRSRAL
jgi:flagellar biosynthesis/type III secretory pathway M-ring protein FliF/YscJ